MPKIELLNIDCMEYMAGLPDKAFDLAIVDPPYGVGNFSQNNQKNRPHSRPWKIDWNNYTPDELYFNEVKRVSKNYIIWGENYYKEWITDPGGIIWIKGNNSPVGSQAELAATNMFQRVVIYEEKWTGFINSEGINTFQKIHPCQKPINLYKWQLQEFAQKGWRILDTHLGSGSSAIAAHQMGFDFVGTEIDKDYFDAAQKRFKEAIKQQSLFPSNGQKE